jgi:hypothetical protein
MPTVNEAIARGCCGQVDRLRSRDKLIPAVSPERGLTAEELERVLRH